MCCYKDFPTSFGRIIVNGEFFFPSRVETAISNQDGVQILRCLMIGLRHRLCRSFVCLRVA